ncbi:hypothetical protein BN2537_15789 [Streptomyces venezuelae]|nr:hypothetical protein BN2537_15789 [Streptomyces venezuelae]
MANGGTSRTVGHGERRDVTNGDASAGEVPPFRGDQIVTSFSWS